MWLHKLTCRGLTRNSKKKEGKKYAEPTFNNNSSHSLISQHGVYNNASANGSAASLRRTHSPTKSNRQGKTRHHHVRQQEAEQPPSQFVKRPVASSSSSQTTEVAKPPLFMCEPFVRTALVKGSYKTIVQLPKYVDYYEWLALNTFEFFNGINRFYGIISEYVTADKFPLMMADPKTEYTWVNSNNKTVTLPANQYIELALAWMSNKINDQSIFPTKSGMAFPPSFLNDVRSICRQIFRIIAHIYWNHFDKIVHLSLEAHWSSFFSHYISFVREFSLIEPKELEPLAMLIENLENQGKIITVETVQRPPATAAY